MVSFKQQVLDLCKTTLQGQMDLLTGEMAEISDSMENETKSSVGDKHETARARMQADHEKLNNRMSELKEQFKLLDRIDLSRKHDKVGSESLVFTDKRLFFIATAIGKLELQDKEIYVLSKDSPIGKQLIGLKEGESVEFNNIKYFVQKIM